MSKITKTQFLADVMHEINTLRTIATEKEIANLDFDSLNPIKTDTCIYGQLTGRCDSERAKELMDKACIRVMNLNAGVEDFFKEGDFLKEESRHTFSKISALVNGENKGQSWVNNWTRRNYKYLSVLESYILLKGAKNKQVLEYIKGEIDTLTL